MEGLDGQAIPQDILSGMGGIQSLGVVNALKTGDPRVDMIVALCLPFALRYLLAFAKSVCKYCDPDFWKNWWIGPEQPTWFHERTISHAVTRNASGAVIEVDGDSHNSILIKAIRLYCHTNIDLKLSKADLSLTTVEDEHHSDDFFCYGQSLVNLLKTYKMVKNPPEKEWHKLGVFGQEKDGASTVELKIDSSSDSSEDENKNTKSTANVTYTLRSLDGKALDSFLDTVYSWYTKELKKKEDRDVSRYYYDLESKGHDDYYNSDHYYKRFRLSEEKTFDSLFFQQKEPILKLIDDFVNKKGKYAIKGYPHKLGLLLTGPPGTGKTSLIKALAQYTGRSVVNVPLSKIETNAELMAQFFDRKYRVPGEHTARLDFKDVIFCLEDLDAASDIVKRRDGKTGGDDNNDDTATADTVMSYEELMSQVPPTKSLWQLFVDSSNETCQEVVKLLVEKSERLQEEFQKAGNIQAVADCLAGIRPGLGLITADNEILREIGQESLDAHTEQMENQEYIDSYLSSHAQKLKRLLEGGGEIDDAIVDTLLSEETVVFPIHSSSNKKSSRTKSKGNDDEEEEDDDDDTPQEKMWGGYHHHSGGSSDDSSSSGGGAGGWKKKLMVRASAWDREIPDALNLMGVLNALDGVVDCPGRIVIMTTNHPERLDRALIRPGRIDKQLYLGYMKGLDVVAMLEHYFATTLSAEQRERVELVIGGSKDKTQPLQLTPAQIECLTAEHDDVEDMIVALESKAVPTKRAILSGSVGAVASS